MSELSTYHSKNLQNARQRVTELAGLKTTTMTPRDLLLWLTRMEAAAQDLLNIVDLLILAGELNAAAEPFRADHAKDGAS